MANAQEVLAQLTNTWSNMLDKFYDSVADEYLQWMAKEYKMNIKELREKAAPLKQKLLAKATEAVSAVKTTKKKTVVNKEFDNSKYGSMSRKELIELSKERSLAVKRKNQDMIDQLKKYDEDHTEEEDQKQNQEEEQEDSDTEPPIVVKSSKNELLEEEMDSEDDED